MLSSELLDVGRLGPTVRSMRRPEPDQHRFVCGQEVGELHPLLLPDIPHRHRWQRVRGGRIVDDEVGSRPGVGARGLTSPAPGKQQRCCDSAAELAADISDPRHRRETLSEALPFPTSAWAGMAGRRPRVSRPMVQTPDDPAGWFAAAGISGALCASLSMVVVLIGHRRALAEVTVLGVAMFAASAMMTSHAIGGLRTTGHEGAGRLAAEMAAPLGLALAAPLTVRHQWLTRWLHAWQRWIAPSLLVVVVAAAALARSTVGVHPAALVAVTAVGMFVSARLVGRQAFLYRVSRRRSIAVAAIATAALFISTLAGPWTTPGSPPSWVLLAADNIALLLAAIAMLYGYRTGREVADVLQPLLGHDPFAALDIGMAPEVEAFVRALGLKDTVTRDHVERTSTTALRAATRVGLPAATVREVAIGALLHDIGKLVIPSEIIGKPSALTDHEYATITSHPEQGERLLQAAPSLSSAAKYVRWHHERPDGRGYPDGLRGDSVSLEVGLVSAADAWDAMTNTRQYRSAMSFAQARDIMVAGSGTQWHPAAVDAVLAVAGLCGSEGDRATAESPASPEATIECLCDHQGGPKPNGREAAREPIEAAEHSGSNPGA